MSVDHHPRAKRSSFKQWDSRSLSRTDQPSLKHFHSWPQLNPDLEERWTMMIFKAKVGVVWNSWNKFPAPYLETTQGNVSLEHRREPRGITTPGTTAGHLKAMVVWQVIHCWPVGKTKSSRGGDWCGWENKPVRPMNLIHNWPWANTKCLRVK